MGPSSRALAPPTVTGHSRTVPTSRPVSRATKESSGTKRLPSLNRSAALA